MVKKSNEKNKVNALTRKKNSGITLIALIITIIVMLILVGVTISMAVNGGLFGYAGKAAKDTEEAKKKEEELAGGKIEIDGKVYNNIDDYMEGKYVGYIPTYSKELLDEKTGVLKENAYWIEYDNGKETARAVVPKGFAVVEGINESKKISDGLVITDKVDEDGKSIGNEFVWIPVTYTKEGTLDEDGYDTGFKKAFYRKNFTSNEDLTNSTTYTEPYAKGYSDGNGTEEAKEYKEMLDSVYKNGGFYIGRYEAGIKTTTGSARISSTTGTTTNWVVQKNCYPYTYVGWGSSISNYTDDVTDYSSTNRGKGALYLSKAMYANKKVGVTSTLCYGVMWDAMLEFISEEKNVTNSTGWGNYLNNSWTIKNTSAMYSEDNGETWTPINDQKTKDSSTCILLTTGADDSFAAKNIYDVAGNVNEWTNEVYTNSNTGGIRTHYSWWLCPRKPWELPTGVFPKWQLGEHVR